MIKREKFIRLSQFTVEGKPMLDVRWWKETKAGPQPTRDSVEVPMTMVTRLIAALQTHHSTFCSAEAKETAEANG